MKRTLEYPIIIRVDKWTVVIFGVMLLWMPIIAIKQIYENPSYMLASNILGIIVVLSYYFFICGYRLKLTEDMIIYSKPIFPSKKVHWSQIVKVGTGVRLRSNSGPYYLDIYDKSGMVVTINIKPFSIDGLARFVEILLMKAPHIDLDESTRALKSKRVPSILNVKNWKE